jgi:CubicO group peptidase (beta-lactamase class C family)
MRLMKVFAAGALVIAGLGAAAQVALPLEPPVAVERVEGEAPTVTRVAPEGQADLSAQDVNSWLDGFMPYALATGDIAGAVVVIVKDGEILTQRGFGYADLERRIPVDPERTLFRPGSVSKLFTWTAVMQLVEQGELDLDADVNRYIDFRISERGGQPVTLRNIMTHTAGFEEQVKWIIGHDREQVPSYQELLKRWVPARVYQPGTTPAYSNYATSLAGYIVERVSGMTFDDYVQRYIFEPLEMNHSTFAQPLPERLQPLMSKGYQRASGNSIPFEVVGPSPAGSLSATGADMARFMIAHLQQGGSVLQPETVQTMHTSAHTVLPHLNRMLLGFYETNINGRRAIAHGGDTVAFHSVLQLFLDENVGVFLSVNSLGRQGAAGNIRTALLEQFADRYLPSPRDERRIDPEQSAEHARTLAGNWYNSRRAHSSFLAALQLFGQVSVGVDAEGRPVVPVTPGYNGEPRQWVEIEPFLWHDLNSHERLAAQVVDGRAVRFSLDGLPFMIFDRVPWHQNAAVLVPLLIVSLIVLALTVLLWPVRALVRRHYKAGIGLEGVQKRAHLLSRIAALLIFATLLGWALAIMTMMGDITNLNAAFDPVIIMLQVLSFIAFVGGFAVLAWNLWATWRSGRRWPAKLWSVALFLAAFVVLWIAIAFNLLGFGVNY